MKLDQKLFSCETCGKSFKKKISLIKHRACHDVSQFHGNDTIEDIPSVKPVAATSSCQTEQKEISKYSYQCENCDFGCKHVKSIINHVKKEHNGKLGFIEYICEYCGLTFKENESYKKHLVSTHNIDPKQKYISLNCEGCGMNQSLDMLMKKHIEMSDSYWKFYDCECGFTHELGEYLKNHIQKIMFHDI